MTLSRARRVLRGTLAASLATFTALLFHIGGGGVAPALIGIIAPLVLSIVTCTLLSGRRLSVLRLTVSVGVSQLLFHALFTLGSPSTMQIVSDHAHHGGPVTIVGVAHLHASDDAMVIAHMIAAVLTVAALHIGDRVLARLGSLVFSIVAWVIRTPVPANVSPPRSARPEAHTVLLPLGVHTPTLRRRGPPALVR